ncbi:Lactadherin [Paramuricea clavata]|uniref:Lactadherin, partial n=1 Tax=Paramuricea clavata TaxID=317549 RepID=A0A7D9KXC0_PARCT|nr:Lactadherin [Paramuricea clavata]
MTHDELSKNHPGGFDDTKSFEKDGRMYRATDDPSDGYNALEHYISKLNPHCSAFFQFPKRKWSPSDSVWHENWPLGVNKLGVMMREISEEAELSSIYTNHCVRATAIALWSDAGLENRHIMAVSGHRNEQSLNSYTSRPSSTQLRQSSDILTRSLVSSNASLQIDFNDSQPAQVFSHVTSTSQNTSMYHRSSFDNIFSSCSIGTVNLTVNPPREVDKD